MQAALFADVPLTPSRYRLDDIKLYLFALAFAAGNLLLPLAVHGIPNGGVMLLPLFFFTLVAAYSEGWAVGLLVAVASPLLNHAWSGMPTLPMLSVVLAKSLFIAFAAANVSRLLGKVSLVALVALSVAMQAMGLLVEWAVFGDGARAIHSAWAGWPGVILMTVGGYALIRFIASLRGRRGVL